MQHDLPFPGLQQPLQQHDHQYKEQHQGTPSPKRCNKGRAIQPNIFLPSHLFEYMVAQSNEEYRPKQVIE